MGTGVKGGGLLSSGMVGGKKGKGAGVGGGERARKSAKKILCVSILLLGVGVIGAMGFLYIKVFRPKDPVVEVSSIRVLAIYMAGFPTRNITSFNITLALELATRNPNKAGFLFSNNRAELLYQGRQVGSAHLPAGQLSATSSRNDSVTLLGGSQLSQADVDRSLLPLVTRVTVSGHVTVLAVFSRRGVATSDCHVNVSVSFQDIVDYKCEYHHSHNL